ncbi:hypothetical protein CDL12_00839 [Handroanthus impetiginosus]|uniref:Sieve element occlusion C-terminal domain-containing protein n=1 Tax=Handroanthus impetiginosus TaxID=429701 RepID=A0A2G9I9I2_9LAMI|nr:hypothetical protein CDL12_00839 [Handroanthus impetiginosus]
MVIAAWELHSLGNKMNNLCHELGEYVDKCQQQIETRLYERLLHMFKENQDDNQNALRTLFALQNEFPFKSPSSIEKCGIHELKNKVVIILISKPDLLPIDKVFLLVQQTSDHHLQHTETEANYAILWVPIPSSREWTHSDKMSFEFFSSRVPWFTVRRPWSLNSTVIKYIGQEWNFKEDPIMVVLDQNGVVTNSNAMDMVWIWGPKAFPFSSSREKELWEEENWMVDFMINGINPLLSKWVEEGKNLCLYGSNNIDWIREFNATINTIKSAGTQLEVVYIGCKNPAEIVKAIIDTIDQEKLSTSLSFPKVQLFWLRLESIKRSIRHQDHTTTSDKIANKLSELIDFNDDNKSWVVFGKGSSDDVIKLDEDKLKECVEHFPFWCKNVASMGLVGAIRSAFEGPYDGGKCDHVEVVPYGEEGLSDKQLICALCKRPMQKFFLYKCDE